MKLKSGVNILSPGRLRDFSWIYEQLFTENRAFYYQSSFSPN
jgi:hypothetical protein